jgi:hypothetical protein
MSVSSIRREIRFLKLYAVVSTLLFTVLILSAFGAVRKQQRLTVLDVERINIIEADGSLRMVLSNRARSPGPVLRGEPFGYPGGNRPGLIFYNDEGTENGGLISAGQRLPDGRVEASHSLTFDQYEQDQIIALQYIESNGERRHGLEIRDRPEMPITEMLQRIQQIQAMPDGPEKQAAMQQFEGTGAQRLWVGRNRAKSATVLLSDAAGRPRLRLLVDSVGAARIDFLDETGRVTLRLPDHLAQQPD